MTDTDSLQAFRRENFAGLTVREQHASFAENGFLRIPDACRPSRWRASSCKTVQDRSGLALDRQGERRGRHLLIHVTSLLARTSRTHELAPLIFDMRIVLTVTIDS